MIARVAERGASLGNGPTMVPEPSSLILLALSSPTVINPKSSSLMNALIRFLAALIGLSALSVARGQTFNILHSFVGGAADGAQPEDSLVLNGGNFFGTTEIAGAANAGAMFKIGIDGKGIGLLHSFAGGANDGMAPLGSLTLSRSALYGMTFLGGSIGNGAVDSSFIGLSRAKIEA
jgi:uncharacterized repeat protein (TIGR03803 family)